MAVKIWDIEKEFYWYDDDGEDLVFKDTIAARNMMYTEGYKYEYMDSAVEFHRYDPLVDDKSGYDLQ